MTRHITQPRPLMNTFMLVSGLIWLTSHGPATYGQTLPRPGQADVLAIAGEPFGVARVRYGIAPQPASDAPPMVRVHDAAGRVLYPATAEITQLARTGPGPAAIPPGRGIGGGRLLGRIGNIVRAITSEEYDQAVGHETWFLFKGSEPLDLVVEDGQRLSLRVVPRASDEAGPNPLAKTVDGITHKNALDGWWKAYTASAMHGITAGDYPPLVEGYLVSMLARRLNLPLPDGFLPAPPAEEDEGIASTLQMVAGTESMRGEIFRRVAAGDTERFQGANLPVPDAPHWAEHRDWLAIEAQLADAVDVDSNAEVVIEPIAQHVPIDSLYLRFGSFKNYLWFRDLSNRNGGDITRMVTLRGFDHQATRRAETLLNMQTTELAQTFGPAVVDDMALVGYDLFLTEGPAMGVLLKAKNAFLLGTSLRSERNAAVANIPGATLENIDLDGVQATLLSTPDQKVRSFLVNDGDYFLVCSSEKLARAFIACGRGGESLADSRGFQYARRLMPVDRDYSIYAYFSERFFQNLVSPQYQIELRRRLYASADIALARLGTLASRAEGNPLAQVDQLEASGFVPQGLGRRPDGSGLIVAGDMVFDSRRGQLGSFKPIPDVEINRVTDEEYRWYTQRAEFYSREWKQMDPLVAGIRPQPTDADGVQRVEIHAEVAPLVPEKYGWIAEQLGPPTRTAIKFAPDDIVALQAYVRSDQLGGTIPPHHLFLAIKDDVLPNPAELDGLLDKYFALKSLSGYLGAWPQPGVLDRLPLGIGRGRPVGPGMTKLLGGLYRYQGNAFSIVSFVPDIITASLPYLEIVEATEPAQARAQIDNLHGTQLESWINQQVYQRNYQTSEAGARLLDRVTAQLAVEPVDAMEVVNVLLDAKLQCPLGGTYTLVETPVGPRWRSSAIPPGATINDPPIGYLAPVLTWFRGATGRVTQYDARLVGDFVIDVATK